MRVRCSTLSLVPRFEDGRTFALQENDPASGEQSRQICLVSFDVIDVFASTWRLLKPRRRAIPVEVDTSAGYDAWLDAAG